MPNIIYEYENDKGEIIYINATVEENDEIRGATRGSRLSTPTIIKKVEVKFEEALGTVKAAAGALKNVIDEINPDEVSVEFSLKTEAEAGFFSICRAATGAEFKVTLTWKNEQNSKTKPT